MVDYLRTIRGDETSAMQATAALLPAIQFADKETLIPAPSRLVRTVTALHAESWEAMSQPKASRRPALKEYGDLGGVAADAGHRVGAACRRCEPLRSHDRPIAVDQTGRLAVSQHVWRCVPAAGEQPHRRTHDAAGAAELHPIRRRHRNRLDGVEQLVTGGSVPKSLIDALALAKTANFDPQYLALRDRIANARVSGEKPEITASQWSPITGGRMGSAVSVAEPALEEAKSRALALRSAAEESLIFQPSLLAGALALALVSMMTLSRCLINPLHAIRDAMLQVAAGDLSVDAGYAERHDEIGVLAGSLAVFKQQAIAKAHIEK
jgi:HAMP domain-containing protein